MARIGHALGVHSGNTLKSVKPLFSRSFLGVDNLDDGFKINQTWYKRTPRPE